MRKTWRSSNDRSIAAFSSRALGEVVAERLLDQQPRRRIGAAAEAGLAQPARGVGEEGGRDREVEEPLRGLAVLAVALVEARGERREQLRRAERAGDDADARLERVPQALVERAARVRADRLVRVPTERRLVVAAAHDREQAEALRQPAVGEQVVDRGQQLARGEVAGRAEQHERRGRRQPLVDVLRERVRGRDDRCLRRAHPIAAASARIATAGSSPTSIRRNGSPRCAQRLPVADRLRAHQRGEVVPTGRGSRRRLARCRRAGRTRRLGAPPLCSWPVECRKRGP